MPALLDALYVAVLVVLATLFEHYYFWPRFRARTAAGVPGARIWAYRRGILGQWAFVAALAAIWAHYDRSLADLRLTVPTGWRAIVSGVLVALMVAVVIYQLTAVRKLTPQRRIAARPKLDKFA
ncbi:MAG: hypothetical protein ACJ8AD_00640, partial [Gemmatimonadaceae bacterium]